MSASSSIRRLWKRGAGLPHTQELRSRRIAEVAHYMQTGVRLALHRQQLVARAQVLFKNRHAERVPEQVPIVIGKTGVALVGERYYRMAEHESVLRQTAQLFHRPCDGGRVEAYRCFGPAGRENADQLALLKTRRQNSCARSRIHRMYEWCA